MTVLTPQHKLKDMLETLALVDKAVARRIEQANDAEARLQATLDAVRKQVSESLPLVESACTDAAALRREWTERRQELDTDLADHRDYLNRGGDEARKELTEHANGLVHELNSAALAFGAQLTAQLAQCEKDAAGLLEKVDARLAATRQELAALESGVEDRLRHLTQRAYVRVESVTEPLHRKMEEALTRCQGEIVSRLEEAEGSLRQRIASVEVVLLERSKAMEDQLARTDESFEDEALARLTSVRQSITEQIGTIEREARAALRPILAQVGELRMQAESQIRAALDATALTMDQRLGEIRRSADESVQLAEQQLLSRVRAIKPRADSALQAAERMIERRLPGVEIEVRIEDAAKRLVESKPLTLSS